MNFKRAARCAALFISGCEMALDISADWLLALPSPGLAQSCRVGLRAGP